METKKVVITGAPGTGKSTLTNELIKMGQYCFEEISRDITLEAKKQGVDQLFLTNPLLFSELLLKGRVEQFKSANSIEKPIVFFDRGIPDIIAYLNYAKVDFASTFIDACKNYTYNMVFILNPWKAIHKVDNERYENFKQALEIHEHLVNTYKANHYNLIEVPFETPENRANFILNHFKI